ncbi:MAG: hypothetical protein HOQ45_11025, partial [Nocardioidaceae bacterium]|nr:hypothetical protein [Nocardioidaceae bacterium]
MTRNQTESLKLFAATGLDCDVVSGSAPVAPGTPNVQTSLSEWTTAVTRWSYGSASADSADGSRGLWNTGRVPSDTHLQAPSEAERTHGRLHRLLHAHPAVSLATKVLVGVVGAFVVAAGVVMLVTPGPAVVVIPIGLAILATEFEFARRWLERARGWAGRVAERAEAVDPRVRRRRVLATLATVTVVAGATAGYLSVYDWPHWSVDSWDHVQGLVRGVPDL